MDPRCACNQCPYMRLHTLEKPYLCLRNFGPEVSVPEPICKATLHLIGRMLALSQRTRSSSEEKSRFAKERCAPSRCVSLDFLSRVDSGIAAGIGAFTPT